MTADHEKAAHTKALPPARNGVPIWVVSLLLVVVTRVQPPDIACAISVSGRDGAT